MLAFVLLMCVYFIGAEAVEGKLTPENYKKAIRAHGTVFCDDLDKYKPLLEALQACLKTKAEERQNAITSCIVKTGKGATAYYDYLKMACPDPTMADDFMKCIEPYANDPVYLAGEKDNHDETVKCYDDAFDGAGIPRKKEVYFEYVEER